MNDTTKNLKHGKQKHSCSGFRMAMAEHVACSPMVIFTHPKKKELVCKTKSKVWLYTKISCSAELSFDIVGTSTFTPLNRPTFCRLYPDTTTLPSIGLPTRSPQMLRFSRCVRPHHRLKSYFLIHTQPFSNLEKLAYRRFDRRQNAPNRNAPEHWLTHTFASNAAILEVCSTSSSFEIILSHTYSVIFKP